MDPVASGRDSGANPVALRLPFRFDPALLRADLARVPSAAWQSHFNTAIYRGDWSGAALRAIPGSGLPLYSDPAAAEPWADTPLLQGCDYLQQVLAAFRCPLLSARLLRLAPGAAIQEHSDHGLGLDHGEVRIHVVVATNPAVECRIDGRAYRWAEGECWYADFGRRHSFANRGDTERVHLVLDCQVNDWLRDLLTATDEGEPTSAADGGHRRLESWRQAIGDDPASMRALFDIDDGEAFVEALSALVAERGGAVDRAAIRQAMGEGRRNWFERNRP